MGVDTSYDHGVDEGSASKDAGDFKDGMSNIAGDPLSRAGSGSASKESQLWSGASGSTPGDNYNSAVTATVLPGQGAGDSVGVSATILPPAFSVGSSGAGTSSSSSSGPPTRLPAAPGRRDHMPSPNSFVDSLIANNGDQVDR